MQDSHTGVIHELHPDIVKVWKEIPRSELTLTQFAQAASGTREMQRAKDEAVPIREHQGPVFTVGEELAIRGGRFRVQAITEKRIYLDSLPSK